MKEMTIKEAVCRVLDQMEEGEKMLGYQLCTKVRKELTRSGSLKRPLESTILRRLREVKGDYHIESHHSVSEYRRVQA